ncbi:hypothetical protein [Geomonas silvestris]|nr:hypothetical protein [Geomonas silvestris]
MENKEALVVKVGKKLKKGHGSFWIPKKAVELLIKDNNATALHIYTYLIIARHADVSGMFSTVGNSGIVRKLGLNSEQYLRVTKYLMNLSENGNKVLYTKDDWQAYAFPVNEKIEMDNQLNVNNPNYKPKKLLPTPPMNKGAGKKGYVQWVLNTFNCSRNEQVWFHNDLIEDSDKQKILKRLLRYKDKDVIARLLLLMYNHNDVSYGGVRPYQNMYIRYDMRKTGTENGIDIYRAKECELCQSDHFKTAIKEVFKDVVIDDGLIVSSLKILEGLGLVYKAVVALSSDPNHKDAVVLYDLDVKAGKGELLWVKKSRNAGLIDEAVKHAGFESSSICGKFYDEYTVIAEEGVTPHVAGIFKLKYEVCNSKNLPVKVARLGQKEDKALVCEWLSLLSGNVEEVSCASDEY